MNVVTPCKISYLFFKDAKTYIFGSAFFVFNDKNEQFYSADQESKSKDTMCILYMLCSKLYSS